MLGYVRETTTGGVFGWLRRVMRGVRTAWMEVGEEMQERFGDF